MHPRVGEAARFVSIDAPARGHANLQIVEGPSGFFASGFESLDVPHRGLEVERKAVPSLGQARGARERLLGMSAEDDFRMRFLHWTRHRVDAAEGDEAA